MEASYRVVILRQKRVKNQEEKLAKVSYLLEGNPFENMGRWNEAFSNRNDIYLEIGCGKGKFIISHAKEEQDKNFIAIEGQQGVLLRALEKLEEERKENDLKNLIFIDKYIEDIRDMFRENEIAGIYLNFSDPWPKSRHAKRRLTHSRFLEGYESILKRGGFIEFKTDNPILWDFSVDELEGSPFKIIEKTEDLHKSVFSSRNFTTEYEDKYRLLYKKIYYLKAVKE